MFELSSIRGIEIVHKILYLCRIRFNYIYTRKIIIKAKKD